MKRLSDRQSRQELAGITLGRVTTPPERLEQDLGAASITSGEQKDVHGGIVGRLG
jgi:hypothetical protein